jgi:hypothetical protein
LAFAHHVAGRNTIKKGVFSKMAREIKKPTFLERLKSFLPVLKELIVIGRFIWEIISKK